MAFIVFEGGEGTGKSTQIRLLSEWLTSRGCSCVCTREPGGTPFAEQIRGLFKAVNNHSDTPLPLTELLMVMAARAQHLGALVGPSLAAGKWVLCDRFLDSSYGYKGIRGGLPKSQIDAVAEIALGTLFPNLTLVLHLPQEEAHKRMMGRGAVEADRLDAESAAVHQIVADGFLRLVHEKMPWFRGKIPLRVLIDASGTVERVHQQICDAVAKHLDVKP
jgi:dTMP kinase